MGISEYELHGTTASGPAAMYSRKPPLSTLLSMLVAASKQGDAAHWQSLCRAIEDVLRAEYDASQADTQ